MVTLYRAEGIPHVFPSLPPGVTEPPDRTRSWTSSEVAARFYCEHHGGTGVVSVTVDDPKVLDLRADPAGTLLAAGFDWDDYDRLPFHDLCRDLAPALRGDYEWVAFYGDAPDPDWDEWLEMSPGPGPQ